jgi:hypothetical protein
VLSKLEHQKKLGNFDRFNETFVATYKLDKWVTNMPEKEKAAQQLTPLEDFVSIKTIDDF